MAEKDDYLVDMLADLGFVTSDQIAQARAEAQSSGVGIVDYMVANKMVRPADVTQAKAAHFGAEVVQLSGLQIADDVIASVPRHIAKKYRVVPVFRHENTLTVAIARRHVEGCSNARPVDRERPGHRVYRRGEG